jgi:hypothetical protein
MTNIIFQPIPMSYFELFIHNIYDLAWFVSMFSIHDFQGLTRVSRHKFHTVYKKLDSFCFESRKFEWYQIRTPEIVCCTNLKLVCKNLPLLHLLSLPLHVCRFQYFQHFDYYMYFKTRGPWWPLYRSLKY